MAAGGRTSIHPEGYTESGDGVAFTIDLAAQVSALLGDEPGG